MEKPFENEAMGGTLICSRKSGKMWAIPFANDMEGFLILAAKHCHGEPESQPSDVPGFGIALLVLDLAELLI